MIPVVIGSLSTKTTLLRSLDTHAAKVCKKPTPFVSL